MHLQTTFAWLSWRKWVSNQATVKTRGGRLQDRLSFGERQGQTHRAEMQKNGFRRGPEQRTAGTPAGNSSARRSQFESWVYYFCFWGKKKSLHLPLVLILGSVPLLQPPLGSACLRAGDSKGTLFLHYRGLQKQRVCLCSISGPNTEGVVS